MNKVAVAVSGWHVVCTESVEVVDLYMDCVKPEDECIDSLDKFGF